MIESISTDELQSRIAEQPLTLVDVREVHEYRGGHVPGAVNIPLHLIPLRLSELPADATLYVICQSGGRSAQACLWLAQKGRSVVNVNGGTGSWIRAGKPVARPRS